MKNSDQPDNPTPPKPEFRSASPRPEKFSTPAEPLARHIAQQKTVARQRKLIIGSAAALIGIIVLSLIVVLTSQRKHSAVSDSQPTTERSTDPSNPPRNPSSPELASVPKAEPEPKAKAEPEPKPERRSEPTQKLTGGRVITFESLASYITKGRSWLAQSPSLEHEGFVFTNLENPSSPDPSRNAYSVAISQTELEDPSEPSVDYRLHFLSRKTEFHRVDGGAFDLQAIRFRMKVNRRSGVFRMLGYRDGVLVEEMALPYASFQSPTHQFVLNWTSVDSVVLDADQEVRGATPGIMALEVSY